MGASDLRLTERWKKPEIGNNDRLMQLVSDISESSKQITSETQAYRSTLTSPEHAPSPTTRSPADDGLIAPTAAEQGDEITPALDANAADDAEKFRSPALCHAHPIEDEGSAQTSRAIRRRRRDLTLLSALCVGAGLATAWPFGLLELPPFSLAQFRHLIHRSQAPNIPGQSELVVQTQTGGVNEPLALGVSLKRGSGGETVVLDRLPEGTQLSLGRSLSANRWSLRAGDLSHAFIAAPKNFTGRMELTAKLYASNNELLDAKIVHFIWGREQTTNQAGSGASTDQTGSSGNPAAPIKMTESGWRASDLTAPTPAQNGATSKAPDAVAAPKAPKPAASAVAPKQQVGNQSERATGAILPGPEIAALLQTGKSLLQQGDVAAARVALRRAAEAGDADAALALAMSFDPNFLRQWKGLAAASDLGQASAWYAKARALGKDVSAELERLARMPSPDAR